MDGFSRADPSLGSRRTRLGRSPPRRRRTAERFRLGSDPEDPVGHACLDVSWSIQPLPPAKAPAS